MILVMGSICSLRTWKAKQALFKVANILRQLYVDVDLVHAPVTILIWHSTLRNALISGGIILIRYAEHWTTSRVPLPVGAASTHKLVHPRLLQLIDCSLTELALHANITRATTKNADRHVLAWSSTKGDRPVRIVA